MFENLHFIKLLPPPYYREIWNYKNVVFKMNSIQNAISNFGWRKSFKNGNANENNKILTCNLMDIFGNFIPQ